MKLFTDGEFINGIDILLNIIDIDGIITKDIKYIFTGEGQIDHQTLNGKAVYSLTKRLKKFNIPILLICGKNILTKNEWSLLGVENIISLSDTGHNYSYCMKNAKQLIEETVESYLKTKDS